MFHIADRHPGLLRVDASARARAINRMFAALSTVEPPILELGVSSMLEHDKPWHPERLPMLEKRIRTRLVDLSRRLGKSNWLDREFSAGDLMMVSVLRRLDECGRLKEYPNLCADVARTECRAAFERAFAAQLAIFAGT